MLRSLLNRLISGQRSLILAEAVMIKGFMALLMKPLNSKTPWTRQEKRELKSHIRHLSAYVPALVIFLLPGGSLMLPLLAELLDRRKKKRPPGSKIQITH